MQQQNVSKPTIFFLDPIRTAWQVLWSNQPLETEMKDKLWVFFPATGQKFPIRFMMTSDLYEVELPAGTYGGPLLEDLRQELKRDFNDVRITK